MRYFVRAVKYFAAFCVLYVGIVWLSMATGGDMGVSVWEQIAATLVAQLLKRLNDEDNTPAVHITLDPFIIERKSVSSR